jgi:hypothetical protein
MESKLELEILPQPDDWTCGPTCLHAVYRYFGDSIRLEDVIQEVVPLETGGTLGVWLACHALARGFRVVIYTYNLHVFDPSWFHDGVDIRTRLEAQMKLKSDPKLRVASRAYLEFLSRGGEIQFKDLTAALLQSYLSREIPILTGLSATYLYGCARERGEFYDDVGGEPIGHFVVLSGYDRNERHVLVADPLQNNPRFGTHYYSVDIDRLIGSIFLGIVTYDANLVVVTPAAQKGT